MTARKTWTLFFAAAMLAAFIVFVERPVRLEKLKVPVTQLLPGFKASEVESVEVLFPGQIPIQAERTAGGWKLIRPVPHVADSLRVEALLSALQQLRFDSHIRPEELLARPKAMEEYGIRNPRLTLTLQSSGNRQVQLLFGTNTIAGDQIYLGQTGGNGIHLVTADLLRFIPPTEVIWRGRDILPAEVFSQNSLRVRAAQRGFDLNRPGTNSLWRIVWPLDSRADNRRVDAGLEQLRTNLVSGFVADGVKDFEPFGLQTPSLEIFFGQGTNFTRGLQIGSGPTNLPLMAFARRLGESSVFLVPKAAVDPWRISQAELRNPRLVDLPATNITKITVQGDEAFTVERKGTNVWAVTAPKYFAADTLLLDVLLYVVTEAPTIEEKALVTDWKPYGLDKPLAEYRFEAPHGGTNEAVAFQVGAGEGGRLFVRRTDEVSVSELLPEVFIRLPRQSWQIGDRRIWNFDSTNVTSVTIQQLGRKKALVRNADGEWIFAPGSQGVVNPFGVEEALTRLGSLQAIYWTARGDVADSYGFKKVDFKLTLGLVKDGKPETLEIEFGGQSRQLHPYAATKIDGERTVFEFPADVYVNAVREYLTIFKAGTESP